jgi:uncharacterized protein
MRRDLEPGDRNRAWREDRELRRLTPDAYTRVPWKNGGGISVTIAGERSPGAAPGDWSGVIWQLGRTDIVTPAPFSNLTGFDRLQTVVTGEGLFLDAPGGAIDLSRPFTVARYDGGTPIVSRLTNGPVGVVNLIARRDQARIEMRVLQPEDGAVLVEGLHILYAPTGGSALQFDGRTIDLAADHGLSIEGPAQLECRSGLALACSIQRFPAS